MVTPQLIELKCRNCGSELSPRDISPQLSAARCRHCNALFALPAAMIDRMEIRRPDVPLPKNFRVDRDMDSVRITHRWFRPGAFFLLIFAVVWNGFIIGWQIKAISQGNWSKVLFGLLHTSAGALLAYLTLAAFLNSTVIRATRFELSVKIGPLPWRGNKRIQADKISQFFCKENVSHGRNNSTTTYSVEAVLQNNVRETIAAEFPKSDQALFVEQELERHLTLTDVPVAGDYGR